MVGVLKCDGLHTSAIEAEDASPRQGQQDGRVGGHNELRVAAAGCLAEKFTQLQLPPRRERAFGLVKQMVVQTIRYVKRPRSGHRR